MMIKKTKVCGHVWGGKVNNRYFTDRDRTCNEFPNGSHLFIDDYVICVKCADIKIIRQWEKRISI